mgnify:CR=1 FL=1
MMTRHGRKPTVTTSEVARLCGLSRSTVSAVLNGKPGVRESTRRKVLQCIRESRYVSGMITTALVDELSRIVAVLAADLGSLFTMMTLRGISSVLEGAGYHILIHNVRQEDQDDPETLASLQACHPAGYIILKGAEGLGAIHARKVSAQGVPLVTHGGLEGILTHSVNVDNRAGMRLATAYVIGLGHRLVGYISGPSFSQGAKERKLGFIESLVECDISMSHAMIMDAGETASDGYRAALQILRDAVRRPTALLCFNDMVAMGVYRAAHELSLDIPHDLSVVGFEGIDYGALLGPSLTTVDLFPDQQGERMAHILLRVIRNEVRQGFLREWIAPKLIERASVRPYEGLQCAAVGTVQTNITGSVATPE